MKKKKLGILLASILMAGAAMLAGCGGQDKPTPTPTPTPEPPPIVETPTYTDQRLSEVELNCAEEFDITKPLTVTFDGVDNAIGYDVRYGDINSTEEELVTVEELTETEINNKTQYSFTINVDSEGEYRIYAKSLAPTKDSQKSENDKGEITIYTDSYDSTVVTKGVDYIKQEFLEFDKTIREYQLATSKQRNVTTDVVLNDILAFNNNKADTFEVWSTATVRGIDLIERYSYKVPGIEKLNSFAEITESLKALESKIGSKDLGYEASKFGNSYGIDCWDKLSTTDKLGEETGLKKALNSPDFEKIVSLTKSPLSTSTSYQDFDIIGLVKYKEEDQYKIGYFEESINQWKTNEIMSNRSKALTNFIEDKNNCTVTETEFEVLPELNITYADYLNKYVTNQTQQSTSKHINFSLRTVLSAKS